MACFLTSTMKAAAVAGLMVEYGTEYFRGSPLSHCPTKGGPLHSSPFFLNSGASDLASLFFNPTTLPCQSLAGCTLMKERQSPPPPPAAAAGSPLSCGALPRLASYPDGRNFYGEGPTTTTTTRPPDSGPVGGVEGVQLVHTRLLLQRTDV